MLLACCALWVNSAMAMTESSDESLISETSWPTSGAVVLNDKPIEYHDEALLRHRRSIGTVFQAFNLFPHMTALKNITLPLEKVHGRTPE